MISFENVSAGYRTPLGEIRAVDSTSLEIFDNEIVGIAGESGCGKTTLLKLIYGQIGAGLTLFEGKAQWRRADGEMVGPDMVKQLWWDEITYIPQVINILNPVRRLDAQIMDSMPKRLLAQGREQIRQQLKAFFARLGLPETVFTSYPHQLSGGMMQRLLFGLATFSRPRMTLADEPTTALDVVSQKKLLLLLREIQREQKNSVVIVSHDLGVHFQITDRIAICYAGHIVELGPTREVFDNPKHPYTKALIASLPRIGDTRRRTGLDGHPPSLLYPPKGCRFAERCAFTIDKCRTDMPKRRIFGAHSAACHRIEELA